MKFSKVIGVSLEKVWKIDSINLAYVVPKLAKVAMAYRSYRQCCEMQRNLTFKRLVDQE